MSTEIVDVQEIDQALETDNAFQERKAKERLVAVEREHAKLSRVGSIMRYIGVAIIMAATGTFLFQRWSDMSQMARYFSFLGFTGGLCVSALLCGLKIKENKGARTLFGVVLTLLPVHCAQLGAILYSQTSARYLNLRHTYPHFLHLSVPTLMDAIIVLVVGLVGLLPMAYMAYSVMARKRARSLMMIGCAMSGALLLPTRDPLLVGLLIATMSVVTLVGERKFAAIGDLLTREALIARCVPFLAIAVMIARQCMLYGAPGFLQGLIWLALSAFLFDFLPRVTSEKSVIAGGEVVTAVATMVGMSLIGEGVATGFGLSRTALAPLLHGMPMVIVLGLMAERARHVPGLFRFCAATALFFTGVVELLAVDGVEACVVALVIGILGVAHACIKELKMSLLAGGALTFLSLARGCLLAIDAISLSSWFTLGMVGVLTVVGASYLERNFILLRDGLQGARKRVAAWK